MSFWKLVCNFVLKNNMAQKINTMWVGSNFSWTAAECWIISLKRRKLIRLKFAAKTLIKSRYYSLSLLYLYYYLNRYMYFECCYIQHHTQTIHPTEKFISMNLLQMSCVITWAWSFLTFEVVEAVRGQNILSQCTIWPAPVLLIKDSIRNEIIYDFQPPFSLHSASIQPPYLEF
jgi:hypothetical protein